eukprot:scaffold245495_cov14-Prasinocladus_malaysianus.AAC.1
MIHGMLREASKGGAALHSAPPLLIPCYAGSTPLSWCEPGPRGSMSAVHACPNPSPVEVSFNLEAAASVSIYRLSPS